MKTEIENRRSSRCVIVNLATFAPILVGGLPGKQDLLAVLGKSIRES